MRPLNDIGVKLCDRHLQMLELLVYECLADKEIAERLGSTTKAIKVSMGTIHKRVGLANATERRFIRVRLARMFRPACPLVSVPTSLNLSLRMWEIARLVAEGYDNVEIGQHTGNATGTIKNRMRVIFNRVGVWSRLELAAWYDAHLPRTEGGICVG